MDMQQDKERRKQAHRAPPKGENWRRDWKTYKALSTSTAQRRAVFDRDGGKCCDCGLVAKEWQSDHDVALYSIPPSKLEDYPACLWYWSLENLKTRGVSCGCHQKKSAAEQKENAKVKRIVARLNGTRRERPKIKSRGFQKKIKPSKLDRLKAKNERHLEALERRATPEHQSTDNP